MLYYTLCFTMLYASLCSMLRHILHSAIFILYAMLYALPSLRSAMLCNSIVFNLLDPESFAVPLKAPPIYEYKR